jgi:hypothetical protein
VLRNIPLRTPAAETGSPLRARYVAPIRHLGAAGGAVVNHEMSGRDVIVKPGTTIDFRITEPLPVMIS